MNRTASSGFTIVELMVTLAVAAILIGFALPAFTDFVRQRTLTSEVNDFVLALTYARSEAVRRGQNVSVQSLGGDSGSEWGDGYQVVDVDGNVLRTFAPVADATTFDATGALNNVFTITFSGRGMVTPQPAGPGAVKLCRDGTTPGRVVNVGVVGRPDVDEVDCP